MDSVHDRVAKIWYDVCAKNGGLYVKLGQSVNTMAHVLPPEYMKYFSNLLDQAPQASYQDVKRILEEDLGSELVSRFKNFEPVAIASASIAQVHRATLEDGTQVAVKIQKPWIQKQLPFDLACYRILVYLLEKAFDLPMFWTTRTVCNVITDESDFRVEALNSERAAQNWNESSKWRNRVYVPKVFSDFTSRRVLVQEFVTGRKINEIVKLESEGFNRKEIVCSLSLFLSLSLSLFFFCNFLYCFFLFTYRTHSNTFYHTGGIDGRNVRRSNISYRIHSWRSSLWKSSCSKGKRYNTNCMSRSWYVFLFSTNIYIHMYITTYTHF